MPLVFQPPIIASNTRGMLPRSALPRPMAIIAVAELQYLCTSKVDKARSSCGLLGSASAYPELEP